MILDLSRFIAAARPHWEELERALERLELDRGAPMDLEGARRLHHLCQRAAADLERLRTYAPGSPMVMRVEQLVARAHAVLQAGDGQEGRGFSFWLWLRSTLPQTVRRRAYAGMLALAVTLAGALFGALSVALDSEAKVSLLPFGHGERSPSERVAEERREGGQRLSGRKAGFAGALMVNNTRVSILAASLGGTWGVGTLAVLFSNGIGLGGVCSDYVMAGESVFLAGWLLPHGVVEIPALLIAGQAGLVLGGAMIGGRDRRRLRRRLREVAPDFATLVCGSALLLVWAGLVEAFLSQYHEPVLPYAVKIAFGLVQAVLLGAYLLRSGRSAAAPVPTAGEAGT